MEILLRYDDMPCTIKSFVRENEDDSYTIVINARIGSIEQQKAFAHEMKHIIDCDLSAELPVDEIETITHGGRENGKSIEMSKM